MQYTASKWGGLKIPRTKDTDSDEITARPW